MQVLRDSSPLPSECYGAALALGNFDGLHMGHKAVIGKAITLAKEAGAPSMVMTFEPHPRRVFAPQLPERRIISLSDKIGLIAQLGVNFLRIVHFTRGFATTTAEDFAARILHEGLRISHAVTGDDFTFGHNRAGDARFLQDMGAKLEFGVHSCPPVMMDGARCSSTRVREALEKGDMEMAAKLLGRLYTLSGPVRHGDKRGRVLGFPTANILPAPFLFLPAFGIYAVRARVAGREANGVASLGVRPDFPLKTPLLEVHLFDWRDIIYGEHMEVALVRRLREERKFDDVEALKVQMVRDCTAAKAVLADA